MTTHANITCARCTWTNSVAATSCRGCGRPLPPISGHRDAGLPPPPAPARSNANLPPAPAPARSNAITGVVTSAPQAIEMTTVQPFWFIVATVAVLFGSVLLHHVLIPIMLPLLLLTLLIHMISGRRGGGMHLFGARVISNAARRGSRGHGIIARRPGQQIRVTDHERTWTVRFLSAGGTDLLMGDPVRVQGRRGPNGDFYATRINNQRTGTMRSNQQLVSGLIVAACIAVIALHFLP